MGKQGCIISEQIKTSIIKNYVDGESVLSISKKNNTSRNFIYELLKKRNIEERDDSRLRGLKFPFNENYFDVLDTQEKIYFLGLLFADGCNYKKANTVSLALHHNDKYLLEALNKAVGSDRNIETNKGGCCKLSLRSKLFSDKLESIGLIPRKSFNKEYPNYLIGDENRHFIRGYFDGNGCITKCGTQLVFSVTSRKEFAESIQCILINETGVSKTKIIVEDRCPKIGRVFYTGNGNVKKICDWMYKDASIYMERKYLKYQHIYD